MTPRTLLFLHGNGGQADRSDWLAPLNAWLRDLGYPAYEPQHDLIIDPDYQLSLKHGLDGEAPPLTWKRGREDRATEHWLEYQSRQEAMSVAIEQVRNEPRNLSLRVARDTPMTTAVSHLFRDVTRYRTSSSARHAVWRRILDDVPTEGQLVILAHSLGTIVALDLLKRLPPDLHVDALITIGAPMGVKKVRASEHHLERQIDFPTDRVGNWVNVFDPGDDITVGTGAQPYFAAALDVKISTGGQHDLDAYMSSPVVAVAIAQAVHGYPREAASPLLPAATLHELWKAHLLRGAYRQSVAITTDSAKQRFRARVNTAREILATRAINDARRSYERAESAVEALAPEDRERQSRLLADSPFAPGRCPSVSMIVHRAVDQIAGEFTDAQLVDASIELLFNPFSPFDIDVSDAHAREALTHLYSGIRRVDVAAIDDATFARYVSEAFAEGVRALERKGVPWAPILVTGGVLLLAATGVGIALAVPAGVAGAAAITATLAAFGPGGMIGGIASVAALTGTAAALTAGGVVLGVEATQARFDRLRNDVAAEIAMKMPAEQMRTLLAQWIAACSARDRIGLPSIAPDLEDYLLRIQAVVGREARLHKDLAPGRPATKDWAEKQRIVDRALEWVRNSSTSFTPMVEGRLMVGRELSTDHVEDDD